MRVGVKSVFAVALLLIAAYGCHSSREKTSAKYYTNRYSFGCYSASDLEEAVKLMNSGKSGPFWDKLRKGDGAECLELKPAFEVCILEERVGDEIRIGACDEKEGLWALKSFISKTREQALSAPNLLPAAVEKSAVSEPEKEQGALVGKALAGRSACVGMSKEQVEKAWGKPERESEVILLSNAGRAKGIQWFYPDGASALFLDGEVARLSGTASRRVANCK